ncbi:hypothetical protein DB30_05730 [Enhygromyxa salina]|uniref:Cyclic nucleotide-binding domain-containing protein n=1 Tax=Enhygromyxa salina TaxID=215803 RepID=A0A0C1ZW87_9BACT|nr:hypothetical protein [Enhygromyxa salina]KIG15303.1 hypothetical protein DB30_05730 [Enhygromyxa salina]
MSDNLAHQPPTPDKASLIRFLLTCPMFQRLSAQDVEPLAARLQMRHYDDGTNLLSGGVADGKTPLRVVVHGGATWEPDDSTEQRGAWMLAPGSCCGLGTVNAWARAKKIPGTWSAPDPAPIRCKSVGPLWVLELAPQDFDEVFTDPQGEPICTELLCMFPTSIKAPEVVAALRDTPQFARVTTPKLYRLLERAPTLNYGPFDPMELEQDPDDPQQFGPHGKSVKGPALYYVVEGELSVSNDDQTVSLGVGELGGPGLFDEGVQVNQFAAKSVNEARAVVLTQRALMDQIRADPGLARALGPRGYGKELNP